MLAQGDSGGGMDDPMKAANFAVFDERGEEWVRLQLSSGGMSSFMKSAAVEWLAAKDKTATLDSRAMTRSQASLDERQASASEAAAAEAIRLNAITSEQLRIAKRAQIMAVMGLIISIASIIISLIRR